MARIVSDEDILPLAALWQETAQAHFLRSMTPREALTALEKRRALAEVLLSQTHREVARSHSSELASSLMVDHCCEMLEAER
ncbi:MAG: hypothetical protein IMW89_22870, partial [Ktedonobacteraceae bacterium]|nr:hypothetical protein [Ktedonobacteraceae bacterium]